MESCKSLVYIFLSMINGINIGWKWLRVATTEEVDTGTHRKKSCNVMLRLKSVPVASLGWCWWMFCWMDFTKDWLWRPTLEGDTSWETNNSHKGAQWTRDQGTSAQHNVNCARKTVSVQESEKTANQVWSWPPLQLQTHRPEANYTNQTHTCVFDTTYLSTRKYRTAFHFTSPWYQRQMHPPSPQETDGTPWHGWPGQN